MYKSSLHIHTKEDLKEGYFIDYDIYDLIDYAEEKGFSILALTCHKKFVCRPEYVEYAKEKNILLIPGVELGLKKKFFGRSDILVLNCDTSIEKVKNLNDLRKYKKNHPEIFVICPHADFGPVYSVGIKSLVENIDLFDAIENSWFYSPGFNRNKKAEAVAKKFNLPFIATSDIHTLDFFDKDYAEIDCEELSLAAVFKAIRENKVMNHTQAKFFWWLIIFMILQYLKKGWRFLWRMRTNTD